MGEHGGRIVAKVLKSRGVDTLFTLSGGHLFSIYDGCKEEGIRIVDVRHEQTAAFAAEGLAKATRGIGVAALTAGPGGDQRDERDRRRPGQRLADRGSRRPGAGDALGLGVAAGDRPSAVRHAAGQVGGDGEADRRDRRADRSRTRSRRRSAERTDLPRLSARRRLQRGRVRAAAAPGRRRGAGAGGGSRRRRRSWPGRSDR